MRIAILGGLDRNGHHLEKMAKAQGHRIEHHHGRMTGPSSAGLKASIARADLVVVVTDVNSHAAVSVAKDVARRKDVALVMVRRLREVNLEALLSGPAKQAA